MKTDSFYPNKYRKKFLSITIIQMSNNNLIYTKFFKLYFLQNILKSVYYIGWRIVYYMSYFKG